MPALQDLPDRVFDVILAQGRLVRYDPDQVVWLPPQAGPDSKGVGIPCEPCGIFVVALGLVKWTYAAAGHSPKVAHTKSPQSCMPTCPCSAGLLRLLQ